jgi:hypothetical protein
MASHSGTPKKAREALWQGPGVITKLRPESSLRANFNPPKKNRERRNEGCDADGMLHTSLHTRKPRWVKKLQARQRRKARRATRQAQQ